MIFVVVISASVVILAVAFVLSPPWRRLKRTPVMVELVDGRTVDGLHASRAAGYVSLINARTFDANGQPVSIDGNINIPKRQVAWIVDGHK